MYIKKLTKVILVSAVFAMISAIAGFWIFEMDWLFLPFPLLAGLGMSLVQKERASYKFLDKLVIGSLVFGLLAWVLIFSRMYVLSHLFYDADFPFWFFYNPRESLIFSLVFSFVSFLGGLAGIVFKGLYFLYGKK